MNRKREAREFCFQYFFHMQLPIFKELRDAIINENDKKAILDSLQEFKESTNTILSDELNNFVQENVLGTLKHYQEIEDIISKYTKNWKIHRLSKVDHTNLMLSTFELLFQKTTPIKVVINEAIEISKKFGTSESASFINGILDKMVKSELNN